MSVVLLTGDLMVASRVAGAAARVGTSVETAGTTEQAVARCAEGSVELLLVDLSAPAAKPQELVGQLMSFGGDRPTIVAFGPHVHEALLSAAREAGCDEVVSRGQFFAQLDALIMRLAIDRDEAGDS
jgi:DNA-binding NarL/FixJ family response regulator